MRDQTKRFSFVVVLTGLLLAGPALGQSGPGRKTFIIPQFIASGTPEPNFGGFFIFQTRIFVINPTDSQIDVTIEGFDDEGKTVALEIDGPPAVPAKGWTLYYLTAAGRTAEAPATGWLKVATDSNAVVRGEMCRFLVPLENAPPVGNGLVIKGGAEPVAALTHASAPISFDTFSNITTGVAIAQPDPGAGEATVTLTRRGGSGEMLATAQLKLAAGTRQAFLVNEIFPDLQTDNSLLEFSSDVPVYATAVSFQFKPLRWWRSITFTPLP